MRALLTFLHRWLGLFTAIFLFIAGLTGAVIAWDHELDEWLNPDCLRRIQGQMEEGNRFRPWLWRFGWRRPIHGCGSLIYRSVTGLVAAMLSITGIVIWARRRRARFVSSHRKRDVSAVGAAKPLSVNH